MPRHRRAEDSPTLHLHPDDASRLGLTDGSLVDIANGQASVRGTLCITDDVLPGVATLPGQWWSEDVGQTGVNGLAPASWTPAGQPAYNDIHVTIRPAASPAPARPNGIIEPERRAPPPIVCHPYRTSNGGVPLSIGDQGTDGLPTTHRLESLVDLFQPDASGYEGIEVELPREIEVHEPAKIAPRDA